MNSQPPPLEITGTQIEASTSQVEQITTAVEDLNLKLDKAPNVSKDTKPEEPQEKRPGIKKLKTWLDKNIKVEMSDGRFLIGTFLCTDKSGNVIIGNCTEFTSDPNQKVAKVEEFRLLGLAMVPGRHIVKLYIDEYMNAFAPVTRHNVSPITFDSDDYLSSE